MSDITLPAGWAEMTGKSVGSAVRDTNEPGGSTLKLYLDVAVDGITNPMTFDFMDIGLPSLAASAYSTQLLAQKKWATQGVSRIISGDSITGSIECPGSVYAQIAGLIGAKGTARIEIPNQGWFSQWRVAILSVDGPGIQDGDRMTGSLVLTVTNTGPDDKSEMGPVFGDYTPAEDDDSGDITLGPSGGT